jgi:hypothetical protein
LVAVGPADVLPAGVEAAAFWGFFTVLSDPRLGLARAEPVRPIAKQKARTNVGRNGRCGIG